MSACQSNINNCTVRQEEIEIQTNPKAIKINDLSSYDKIIISYSGGKDSLASVLYLLELGVPKEQIELWHQDVDGSSTDLPFMDWPVTENYVRITGEALGIKTEFQWRYGGFAGELLRENKLTNDIGFTVNGEIRNLETKRGKMTTRKRFPAKSPDLSRRWCSPYLKIDVFRKVINNHPDLQDKNILVITGERREESSARSRYLESELHPCHKKERQVHWWRSVIDWPEKKIWEIIERHRILPHPAYILGWNRTSCLGCIFSTPDLWFMMREIAPERFNSLAQMEDELNFTIDNTKNINRMADEGKSRVPRNKENLRFMQLALNGNITLKDFIVDRWELPAGAFYGAEGGPV
jgi:3'-phosphoadenosine 5'-phosphosulfate sulfotransferase (PAPS reductase)/FAD synthetase